MKRIIETVQNIFKIEELRSKIVNTLLFLLIYRIGAQILLPMVDPVKLQVIKNSGSLKGGIAGILDVFSGGAFSNASIFALGVMPYITASIIVQLLGIAIPSFQKMQKEGESGRKRLNDITRLLTMGVAIVQGTFYLANLAQDPSKNPFSGETGFWEYSLLALIMMAGTMFVLWLGEKITEKGLGNGTSMIIMTGILATLPEAIINEITTKLAPGGAGSVILVAEFIGLFFVVLIIILLVQGTRRIPINFAKKVVGNKQYGGQRQFLPLKVNAAGVMPIIFAQAILLIPVTLFGLSDATAGLQGALTDITGVWYNIITVFMIVVFTYFYTAIYISPNQMADDIKRNGGFIPGVKPGPPTAHYIDDIMTKITLPGSLFLALVAILPALAMRFGITQSFSRFFGGTSLLIAIGVVLDTLQQIESHLLNQKFDGLMKSGRIKGRSMNSDVKMIEKERA